MPVADPSFGWQEAIVAFATISIVAFLVTWVVTDLVSRPHGRRTWRSSTVTTLGLAAGYLAWSGTSVADLAAAAVGLGPPRRRHHGGAGGASGASPARRTDSRSGSCACRTPPLGGGRVRNRRGDPARDPAGAGCLASNRGARMDRHRLGEGGLGRTRGGRSVVRDRGTSSRLSRVPSQGLEEAAPGALVGCGVQAFAFLVTGSVLAPIVAHVVLHWQLALRGNELPPVSVDAHTSAVDGRAPTRSVPGRELVA